MRVAFLGGWLLLVFTYASAISASGKIVLHSVLVGGLLLHLLNRLEERQWSRPKPLFPAWLILFLVLAAAIAVSVDPRLGLEFVLRVILPALVVYQVVTGGLFEISEVVWGFILAAVGLSTMILRLFISTLFDWIALSQVVGGDAGLLPPTFPPVEGLGEGPNVFGAVLAMALPFALFVGTKNEKRLVARLAWVATVIIGAGLFVTVSRGAWLGALSGLGVAFLLNRSTIQRRERARWSQLRRMTWVASAIVAATGVGAAVVARPPWLFVNTLGFRGLSIGAALAMLEDRPLAGFGPGTYPGLVGQFVDTPLTIGERLSLWHSHNTVAQIGADAGLVGLAGAMAATFLVARLVVGLWRQRAPTDTALIAACCAALVAFAVHGLVDAQVVWVGPMVSLAVVIGLVVKLSPERSTRASSNQLSIGGLGTILLLVAGVAAWVVTNWAHVEYANGLDAAQLGRSDQAVAALERATRLDPALGLYWRQLGTVELLAFEQDPRIDLLVSAEEHLGRAVSVAERDSAAWVNLAYARSALGDQTGAVDAAEQSAANARLDEAVLITTGQLFEALGFEQRAADVFEEALALDPSLVLDDFWAQTEVRMGVQQIALESIARTDGRTACGLAASAALGGQADFPILAPLVDACRLGVESGTAGADGLLYWSVFLFQTDAPEAAEVFGGRLVDSGNPRERLAHGVELFHNGDVEGARSEWLAGMLMGDLDSAALLVASYPSDTLPAEVGLEAFRLLSVSDTVSIGAGGSPLRMTKDRTIVTYWRQVLSPLLPAISGLPVSPGSEHLVAALRDAPVSRE